MASLTINIPAEYVGLFHAIVMDEAEMAGDDLRWCRENDPEQVGSERWRSSQVDLRAAQAVCEQLRGLREPNGSVHVAAAVALIARSMKVALMRLADDLQGAAGEIAYEPAEVRRVVNAIGWFATLVERAESSLFRDVLAEAEAVAA